MCWIGVDNFTFAFVWRFLFYILNKNKESIEDLNRNSSQIFQFENYVKKNFLRLHKRTWGLVKNQLLFKWVSKNLWPRHQIVVWKENVSANQINPHWVDWWKKFLRGWVSWVIAIRDYERRKRLRVERLDNHVSMFLPAA